VQDDEDEQHHGQRQDKAEEIAQNRGQGTNGQQRRHSEHQTHKTAHLPQFFITFIVGSVLFNGVCVLLMKPAKALAVRSVEKQSA
jgi:hypothetical protein